MLTQKNSYLMVAFFFTIILGGFFIEFKFNSDSEKSHDAIVQSLANKDHLRIPARE